MASAGFSAPVRYWLPISGLTLKASSDGRTSQLAEAPDEYGDAAQVDAYGEVVAPSNEYAVTGEIANTANLITLGNVMDYTVGQTTIKLMPTTVVVNTQAGQPPTVTISGVQVESGATVKRSYGVKIALSPRSKAQDVAGAFTASNKFTSITTTFTIDPHVQTVGGVPVASDCSHGRVEVQATMTDGDNTGTIEIASGSGFVISAAEAVSNPDAGYVTRTATAWKALAGTTHTGQSASLQSVAPPSGGDGNGGDGNGGDGNGDSDR